MEPYNKKKQTTKQSRIKRYRSVNACLNMILARLYAGETLSIKNLASECNVSLRTMQRYINERLSGFPIEKKQDLFFILWDNVFQSLDRDDRTVMHILNAISRQQGMIFYQIAQKFLSHYPKQINNDCYHFPSYLTPTDSILENLHILENAIQTKQVIQCRYKMNTKSYDLILHPLKILNFNNHWYLLALSKEKLKKYHISKCSQLKITDRTYTVSKTLETALAKTASIWFDPDKEPYEVQLFIHRAAAEFFEKNPINPTQTITGRDQDGSIEIALEITHDMEIIPTVKQWIPHLRILSPKRLDVKIKKEITSYITTT